MNTTPEMNLLDHNAASVALPFPSSPPDQKNATSIAEKEAPEYVFPSTSQGPVFYIDNKTKTIWIGVSGLMKREFIERWLDAKKYDIALITENVKLQMEAQKEFQKSPNGIREMWNRLTKKNH